MSFMAFFEVIGVGSIIPFLSVLGNPKSIETNYYLNQLFDFFQFANNDHFLIFLGFMALVTLLFSSLIKSITSYAKYRFTNIRRHSISQRLLAFYLKQSYDFFLKRNSSEISKLILSETDIAIQQVILPFLNLLINTLVTITLVSFLILVDPALAIILSLIFFIFYIVLYNTIRNYVSKIGEKRNNANSKRFKIISEIIGGIKELKVLGREYNYFERFKSPSYHFSHFTSTSQTLSEVPQFMVEVIAFGTLLAMAIYTIVNKQAASETLIPLLGLYALGALKLKPAVNNIYRSLSMLKFGESIIDNIINDLHKKECGVKSENNFNSLLLNRNLIIKDLSYKYPNTSNFVLKNINLDIQAKSTVGIIGTTGSGKSTLVDILLGLLFPTSGQVNVDGIKLIKENLNLWRKSIGYVPQSIFLADDTITNNIAFGIDENDIDFDQVVKVSKMAQLHQFVISLDNEYDTIIGERGVRLSGGQRQRIGIARSLYHNPELLILDEATSALDNVTEENVMKAIYNMSGKKTIIMIAHRITTLNNCDKIIKLEKGRIIAYND